MTENTFSRRDFLLKSSAIGTGLLLAEWVSCGNAFGQSIYNPNITELTQFVRGDLPILIVDNWFEVNQELLDKTILEFKIKTFQYEKLSLKYWRDKIQS